MKFFESGGYERVFVSWGRWLGNFFMESIFLKKCFKDWEGCLVFWGYGKEAMFWGKGGTGVVCEVS